MEPIELADHLRVSLLDRLRKLAAEEETKTASVPTPPPKPVVLDLSPGEKQARWRRAMPVIHHIADMLYGKRMGMADKVATVIAGETFRQAARDLGDWAPRSEPVVGEVLRLAGVKTAEDHGAVTADYVGRLFAHGLMARHLEKLSEDPATPWWQSYGFLTDPTDASRVTGTEGVESADRQPWSIGDVLGYPTTPGEPPVPELRGKTTEAP